MTSIVSGVFQGYFKPSIPFFLVTVGQLIFFELFGLFIIWHYGNGWFHWVLGAFLIAAGQVCHILL